MLVRMAHMTVEHNVNVKGSIIASKPHIILHGLQLTILILSNVAVVPKAHTH